MNKRDLIKALFKDPTIKALYESGHFNPTDINRAILTEARSSVMEVSNDGAQITQDAGESGSQQKKNTSDTSTNKEQKYPTANIESSLEQFNQLVRNHKPKFDLSYLRKYRDLLIKVNTEDFQDENFLTYLTKIAAPGSIPQGVISAFQKNNMPEGLLNQTPWKEEYQDHMKYIKEYQLAKVFLDGVIQNFESLNWEEDQEKVIDRIVEEVNKYPQHGRRSTMWASNLFFDKFEKTLEYNAYVSLYGVHANKNKDMGTHTFFSEFDALFQKAVKYNEGGGPYTNDLFDMSEKFDGLNIENQTFINFSTPGREGARDTVERFRKAIAAKIIINNLNVDDIKSVSEELITGALGESRGQKKFTDWYVKYVLAEDFVSGLKNLIQSNSKDSSTQQDGEEESGSADTDSQTPQKLKDYMLVYEELIGDSLDKAIGKESLYSKSFVIYFLQQKIEKEETLEQDDKVKYYATAKEFYEKVGSGDKAEDFAGQMEDPAKKSAIIDFLKTEGSIGNLKNMISPESETEEVTVDNAAAIAKLNEFLEGKDEIKTALEKYPEFKKLLAVAYVKALSEKSPAEDEEQPQTPTTGTPSVDTGEEEQATATQESINRALSGIFLMENEASTETSVESGSTDTDSNTGSNGEGGGQISVGDATEVEKMLKDLETVFTAANLKIDVKTIWDLSQKKESEPEKEVDPNEDVSPPDLAEFQEKWTEELQTFFGKNPKKSSFMRRLLLRSQAEMLYKVLATLEEIADPAQMAALTDMNQDDEKENQAEEEVESTLQESRSALKIDNKPKDRSEVVPDSSYEDREERLKTAQETSMDVAAQDFVPNEQSQPEENRDKVELPAENKRIIKQDLQSMVDLLRQVKKAISSYSKYSTQKSVDPRFDGSKLKANMDDLLTQVQDDIYDLYSNLKPAAPKATPEPQGDEDDNLEEALNGIMLEEADPERQEQIKFVREVYDNAKEEYIYVLATSMEGGKWSKSQQSAKNILEILKDDKFISLFPTGMKTASGRVMTVGKAYEVMKEMIQDFIETVRDIVLISKTKYISTPSLTQARNNLLQISTKIADLFQVASKFPAKEIKKAKEAEAANPANKALTPAPSEELEQASEDSGPTVEKPATTDVESGEQEEPPIQLFFDLIFTQNQRETPNKAIIERIKEKFPDEEDQIKAKQIFSYFLLYFLPETLEEQEEEEEDRVLDFVRKFIKNSQTPSALRDFLKTHTSAFTNNDGILRLKTPEEMFKVPVQARALSAILRRDSAMQQFIANLKGDASAEAGGAKKEGEPEPKDASTDTFWDDVFKGTSADPNLSDDPTGLLNNIANAEGFEDIKKKYGKYVFSYLFRLYDNIKKKYDTDSDVSTASRQIVQAYNLELDNGEIEETFLKQNGKFERAFNKFKKHFPTLMEDYRLIDFVSTILRTNLSTRSELETIESSAKEEEGGKEEWNKLNGALRNPKKEPALDLSHLQVKSLADIASTTFGKDYKNESIEAKLKPIIEKMLNEHYNY